MAAALNGNIVTKKSQLHATVELHGKTTRGQMIIDWRCQFNVAMYDKPPNITLIQEMDKEAYEKVLMSGISAN